jgi:hypothetical protein
MTKVEKTVAIITALLTVAWIAFGVATRQPLDDPAFHQSPTVECDVLGVLC